MTSELKICRICLATDVKFFHFDQYNLKSFYEETLVLKVLEGDELPHYFCFECATMLDKFHKFKVKCRQGWDVLGNLLWLRSIKYETVKSMNRRSYNLSSTLEVTCTENIDILFSELSETTDIDKLEDEVIAKVEHSTDTEVECDFEMDIENEVKPYRIIPVAEVDIKVEKAKPRRARVKKKQFKKIKRKEHSPVGEDDKIYTKRPQIRNSKGWKLHIMDEETARQSFNARKEDSKYIKMPFKCTDCYKGFSKEDILKRHMLRRHEVKNGLQCNLCKMRFKFSWQLRKHMRDHYTIYECLRCGLKCPLEASAILHEEVHTGIVRKCPHCNEEFRHQSTYYSHMRTHRSNHICTICGSSFVSELGLLQHKRVKHLLDDENQADEDVSTFCEKCNKTFETRKAFEYHLFHSAMHIVTPEDGKKTIVDIQHTRKVLGKRTQAMISEKLKQLNRYEDIKYTTDTRILRRLRRDFKKPTTCHQCGKHFETQAACMKHHIKEHPRTSFYAQSDRHICEICGASLAPGSVATHQNTHTKEKIYKCDTCSREFFTSMSLKRHQLTHTGEKPHKCSLCDKRFTQSNSMKLHYRTFHLKEPYPKRIRRKKNEDPSDNCETSSDCDSGQNNPEQSRRGLEPAVHENGAYLPLYPN
ncbi:zinc finger protein 883-like [Leptidea sinapis]|uniref:zinc finger protein 883-like n=1 Tax=Leptidea sinapis TaxID=189913 RepID=UPI0021C2A31E|nr:zinc finger protein 883-like [Leptidea sinapis]